MGQKYSMLTVIWLEAGDMYNFIDSGSVYEPKPHGVHFSVMVVCVYLCIYLVSVLHGELLYCLCNLV